MAQEFQSGQRAGNLRSPLSCWLGGKWLLSKKIIPLIPAHQLYCEPFFGAGWILIRKQPSLVEVANDINGDLINCWRVIQQKPDELLGLIQNSLISRQIFNELRDMTQAEIAALSDVENAWRLLYLLKNCFGGRDVLDVTQDETGRGSKKPTFAISRKKFCFITLRDYIRPCHGRIKNVAFECREWDEVIKLYDRAASFFYLDPPYIEYEKFYGSRFSREDFARLACMLKGLKGKFILSLNRHPLAFDLFGDFLLHEAGVRYTVNSKSKAGNVTELLISNFEFDSHIASQHGVVKL